MLRAWEPLSQNKAEDKQESSHGLEVWAGVWMKCHYLLVELELHYGFFTFDNFSFSAVTFHFAASNVAKNHAAVTLLSYIYNFMKMKFNSAPNTI